MAQLAERCARGITMTLSISTDSDGILDVFNNLCDGVASQCEVRWTVCAVVRPLILKMIHSLVQTPVRSCSFLLLQSKPLEFDWLCLWLLSPELVELHPRAGHVEYLWDRKPMALSHNNQN